MAFEDRTLTCVECNEPFTFSADDQQYHADKGYENEPKPCESCRQARRNQSSGGGFGGGFDRGPREMHPVVCAAARTQRYLSYHGATARSTVATASADEAGESRPGVISL